MNVVSSKELGKSVVMVGTTAALSQLLSIGYLVFLARWIGPETYALHVGIFNLCAVSIFFVNWGLDTWLLKKTSEDQQSSSSMLKSVLSLKIAFGIIWAVALFTMAPLLRQEIFLRTPLILAILSTLFESLTNSIYTVFLTTNRFRQSSAILLMGRLARFASLLSLFYFSVMDLDAIIASRALIDFLVLVIASRVFGLKLTGWQFSLESLKNNFVDAAPFHASDLINIVFRQVDVTLVTFLSKSLTTISNYSLMISFFNVISTIILSLMNVIVPSLAKQQTQPPKTQKNALVKTIVGFFVLGLVIWAAISLFGHQAIQLILGNQYALVADMISKTAVIVLISSINVGFTAIMIAQNRQRERVIPQIVSLIFKLVASLLLFPLWQVEGLQKVYILSEFVLSMGYFFIILRGMQEITNTEVALGNPGDKLKIALITFNQEGEGTYLRAYFLGKELVRLGYEVTILSANNEGRKVSERDEEGLKIVVFPRLFKNFFLSGWGLDELFSRLLWVGNHQFDVVHAFECRPTTLIPARLLQRNGSAFFTDWADWLGKGGSVEERPVGLKKNILRFFETWYENRRFWKSDGLTAICGTLVNQAIRRGYDADKILLLPNGMNNPYIHSIPMEIARAKKEISNKSAIIGYIGSGFEKDMNLMYSAFSILQESLEDVKLLHIGRSNYHTQSNKDIICTGPVNYEDVSIYLSACDIFWFPLKKSSANLGRMPLKLSDYLTIGRPIISTDVGDLAYLIRDLGVGLVGEDNPQSISSLVLQILHSQEQQEMMSTNARLASVKHEFSWEKRAEDMQNFYISRMGHN